MKPIREIVDLGRELYNGMPNVGGLQIAFWPVDTFDNLEKVSQGKLGMESRMMLLAEHCSTHVDAPRHFDRAGVSVAEVPLERLHYLLGKTNLNCPRRGDHASVAAGVLLTYLMPWSPSIGSR